MVAFNGVAMTVDAARRKLSKMGPNIPENRGRVELEVKRIGIQVESWAFLKEILALHATCASSRDNETHLDFHVDEMAFDLVKSPSTRI